MDANLEKIRDARILKELWNYDRIWINGRSYRNLKELGRLFDHNALRNPCLPQTPVAEYSWRSDGGKHHLPATDVDEPR